MTLPMQIDLDRATNLMNGLAEIMKKTLDADYASQL